MTQKVVNIECEALLTLEDDYFLNCILELETLLEDGWAMQHIERDPELNTMFVTLKRDE
jgi:hypothetical protein